MAAFCRKSYWRMSQHPTVHEALSDERLFRAGYPTFTGCYVDFNKARGIIDNGTAVCRTARTVV